MNSCDLQKLVIVFSFLVISIFGYSEEMSQIYIAGIEINSTTADGRSWDQSTDKSENAPDPYVVIWHNGQPILKTATHNNTYRPVFLEATHYRRFQAKDTIKIIVYDADAPATGALWVPYQVEKRSRELLISHLDKQQSELIYQWQGSFAELRQAKSLIAASAKGNLIGIQHQVNILPAIKKPLTVVYISSLQVSTRSEANWDPNGEDSMADPYYIVLIDGIPVLVSKVFRNSHSCRWPGCVYDFPLSYTNRITLLVRDADRTSRIFPPAISAFLPLVGKFDDGKYAEIYEEICRCYQDQTIAIWQGTMADIVGMNEKSWQEYASKGAQSTRELVSEAKSFIGANGLQSLIVKASITPPRVATTDKFRLILENAAIFKYKGNSKRWDLGIKRSLPDPFVVIEHWRQGKRQKVFTSKIVKNSLSPKWDADTGLTLMRADRLIITVYDKDLRKDDLIGSTQLTIVAEHFKAPAIFLCFGQLTSLRFKLKAIETNRPQ